MFDLETFNHGDMARHSIVQYPLRGGPDIHSSVPMGLALDLGTVWRRADPIAEPVQAGQILEDTGKVLLAATLACSGSLKDKEIPDVINATEAVNSNWDWFNPVDFVRTTHPNFQWCKPDLFKYETCISAGVGAILLGRTIEQMVENAVPLEQATNRDPSPIRNEFYLTYRFPVHQPALNSQLTYINDGNTVSAVSITVTQARYTAVKRPFTATASNFYIKLEADGKETLSQINASLSAHQDTEFALGLLHASQNRLQHVNGTLLAMPTHRNPAHVLWQMHDALRATKRWRRLQMTQSQTEPADDQ